MLEENVTPFMIFFFTYLSNSSNSVKSFSNVVFHVVKLASAFSVSSRNKNTSLENHVNIVHL